MVRMVIRKKHKERSVSVLGRIETVYYEIDCLLKSMVFTTSIFMDECAKFIFFNKQPISKPNKPN